MEPERALMLSLVGQWSTEVLWLMAVKEKWLSGDVPAAREVLERVCRQILGRLMQ